jgi:ATP-dependent helicase/nuclease subunit B
MPRARLVCGGYRVLEQALWSEIERLQAHDPLFRLTVVAPSHWLVRHLKLAAARRWPGGLFGVRFLNLLQFVVTLSAEDAARVVSATAVERLLLERLESLAPDGDAASDDVCTYDFAGALAAAVRDLRDAAVDMDPAVVVDRLRSAAAETGSQLHAMDVRKFATVLDAYRHYRTALDHARLLDGAELYRHATLRAAAVTEPVLVYGFYDMTQVQADLVSELGRHVPVSLLVPGGSDRETWRFGDWFRQTFAPTVTTETIQLSEPASTVHPEIRSATGERDEMWFCVKDIRRLLDEGVPAEDIAVVARTVEPYLRHIEVLFDEHAIPYEGPSGRRLADQPLVQMARLLFRAPLEDSPRAAVMAVVRHPLFRAEGPRHNWALLTRALRIQRGPDWDRLARYEATGYRVSRGAGATDREVSASEILHLRSALSAVRDREWPTTATWERHAEAHLRALDDSLSTNDLLENEAQALGALRGVLGVLGRFDQLCAPVDRERFLDAFDRECGRRLMDSRPSRGVAVLDAMAIRGLSFRHVFLLGMNARVFPRFILEEPFISDTIRREVFRVLGHHLSVRMDGYAEERLLFHLVCGAATERLICVYQRADSKGRVRDPSPFIRPFLPAGPGPETVIPHSEAGKRAWIAVRSPRELVLAAEDATAALAAFGGDADIYARGRRFLEALEAGAGIGEHEGFTGRIDAHWTHRAGAGFSATQLNLFAQCPFRYFAREVLRLSGDDRRADEETDFTPLEVGELTHTVLERLYRALVAAAFDPGRAHVLLEDTARAVFGELERDHGIAVRGLLEVRRQQIVRAVRAFVDWDLAHLENWRPVWLEQESRMDLAGVPIRGVIDRIDRHVATGELRVIDYKLRFRHHWSARLSTQAMHGQKLQAPLYMHLAPAVAAQRGHPEARATEMIFHFVEDYAREDPAVQGTQASRTQRRMTAAEWERAREAIGRAVRTFAGMIRDGWFFPRPDDGRGGHCRHCDFTAVCRKGHPGLTRKIQPDRTPAVQPYWDVIRGRGAP